MIFACSDHHISSSRRQWRNVALSVIVGTKGNNGSVIAEQNAVISSCCHPCVADLDMRKRPHSALATFITTTCYHFSVTAQEQGVVCTCCHRCVSYP